ncbi:Imm1 family immunity protein [Amycolatopsis sp. NPDC059027]|uniref:Imm1 family immunity protein n=1 Tax=Amycolatopsis sp. NPDC059027 TaxID=3346709 RepID=UPI003670C713
MSDLASDILERVTIETASLPEGMDLVEVIRAAAGRSDPEWGSSWVLVAGDATLPSSQRPQLVVGVRGTGLGAISWHEPGGAGMIPSDGRNPDYVDYSLGDLHHTPMPPRAELPLDRVLTAVGEFVRTGRRPESVTWTPG